MYRTTGRVQVGSARESRRAAGSLRRGLLALALGAAGLGAPAAATAQQETDDPVEGEGAAASPSEPGAELADHPGSEQEARALFDAGQLAFADGRFEDALDLWRRAHLLSGHRELLYNIATVLDRLGRRDAAVLAYETFLEEWPEAPNRNYVARRVEILRQLAEDETSVSQEEARATEGAMALQTPDGSAAEPSEGGADGAGPDRTGPVILWVVAGASLAALIGTAVAADQVYGDLEAQCPGGACGEDARGDHDTLTALTVSTDVLIGVTALAAAGGLLWWLLDDGGGDSPTASAACGPTGCAASLRGRF